jgi:hypothetical protein
VPKFPAMIFHTTFSDGILVVTAVFIIAGIKLCGSLIQFKIIIISINPQKIHETSLIVGVSAQVHDKKQTV